MTMEEKICKNCIHYQMCVDTFRKGKQDGEYLLIEEDAYFAHADGCDYYADNRIYRKQTEVASEIFAKIEECVEVALMNGDICQPILCIGNGVFATLKKKYTEGEKE